MLRNILAASRYVIILPVIGTFLASVAMLVYGLFAVFHGIIEAFSHISFTTSEGRVLEIESIEIIDLFLLGTVLYIVALGLYNLFIDDQLPTPKWLVITSLDSLKEKLVGVIVVLLAVTFLGNLVSWDLGNLNLANSTNILALGLSVGVVLFALGYLLSRTFKTHETASTEETKDEAQKLDD